MLGRRRYLVRASLAVSAANKACAVSPATEDAKQIPSPL